MVGVRSKTISNTHANPLHCAWLGIPGELSNQNQILCVDMGGYLIFGSIVDSDFYPPPRDGTLSVPSPNPAARSASCG